MSDLRPAVLPRLQRFEVTVCQACSRSTQRGTLRLALRTASRLGDGPIWFALAVALPLLFGAAALSAVARLAALGVVAGIVSAALKRLISRPRPYVAHGAIVAGAHPLDRFSFPSGHTLHAVAFTVVATAHYPMLAWLFVPFTLLVAYSRVALGLHYPSDVAAGAAIGGLLAWACLCAF